MVQKRQGKLIPGVTKIGSITATLNGKPQIFEVYFGNRVSPLVNDKMMRLPKDKYNLVLTKFMQGDGNGVYLPPTEQEQAEAIRIVAEQEQQRLEKKKQQAAMQRQAELEAENARKQAEAEAAAKAKAEAEAKAKAEAEELARQKAIQAKAEEDLRIKQEAERMAQEILAKKQAAAQPQPEVDDTMQADTSHMFDDLEFDTPAPQPASKKKIKQERTAPLHSDYDQHKIDQAMNDSNDDDIDEEDEAEEDMQSASKQSRASKLMNVVVCFALLVSLAMNCFMFYKYMLTPNAGGSTSAATEKSDDSRKKTVNFEVNGKTYQLKVESSGLKDGSSQITVYGIASTSKGGKIENAVIPMGVINLDDISLYSDEYYSNQNTASPDVNK